MRCLDCITNSHQESGECHSCSNATEGRRDLLCGFCSESMRQCEACRSPLPPAWDLRLPLQNDSDLTVVQEEIRFLQAQPRLDTLRLHALNEAAEDYLGN